MSLGYFFLTSRASHISEDFEHVLTRKYHALPTASEAPSCEPAPGPAYLVAPAVHSARAGMGVAPVGTGGGKPVPTL